MTRSRLSWLKDGLSLALVSLALMACADRVTAPDRAAPLNPSLSEASVESGTGTFSIDEVAYWQCAGEDVHNVFTANLRYTLVTTPNGSMYRELWYSQEGIGTVTGLTSGTVWRRDVTASPFILRDFGGGMVAYVYRGRFVSETGPTLFIREVFHVSANANGVPYVDRYEVECNVGGRPN